MFAIAFDLCVADAATNHPKGVTQAYADIRSLLETYDFEWKQGSVYLSTRDDLTNLFAALNALKALPWFPRSVKDIRAFKVEHWSNFTPFIKGP